MALFEIAVPISARHEPEALSQEHAELIKKGTFLHVNQQNLGKGILYLSRCRLYWVSSTHPSDCNFGVAYEMISLHALCKDTHAWPVPCLYCQLDLECDAMQRLADCQTRAEASRNAEGEICASVNGTHSAANPETEEDQDTDDDEPPVTELRFSFEDESALDDVFRVISTMSALNPDTRFPAAAPSDDEDILEGCGTDGPFEQGHRWYTADHLASEDGDAGAPEESYTSTSPRD